MSRPLGVTLLGFVNPLRPVGQAVVIHPRLRAIVSGVGVGIGVGGGGGGGSVFRLSLSSETGIKISHSESTQSSRFAGHGEQLTTPIVY